MAILHRFLPFRAMNLSESITRRRMILLRDFAFGQVLLQLLAMLAGLVALRTMSVSEFAQYSLAFAFTSVLSALVDAGFTRSITALVGERTQDVELIGRYLAVARRKRGHATAILAPVAAVLFMAMSANHDWTLETRIVLVGGIVASVWLQGSAAMYGTPLLITSRVRRFYAPQSTGAAGRLAGFGVTAWFGLLTPVVAVGLNALNLGFVASRLRRSSLDLVPARRRVDPELSSRMNAYLRPLWPGLVFLAVQSQIIIFVVTVFADTTTVGEVAALGRVAALFVIVLAAISVLVGPLLARTPQPLLVRRYVSVLGLCVVGGLLLTLGAILEPRPILWLLGGHYDHLRTEVSLIVLSSSLSVTGLALWTMNNARLWVFAWHTRLYIGLTVVTQVACVVLLDVSTTRGAVLFGVWTNLALLVVQAIGAGYGLGRLRTDADDVSS